MEKPPDMPSIKKALRQITAPLTTRGTGRRCGLCSWEGGRFLDGGETVTRPDVRCPRCGSLERHRLARVLLAGDLGPDEATLHVAPERALTPWLKGVSSDYLSIDLAGRGAMLAADLTDLVDIPDASRTLVYCSHVLEHIPDDAAAMTEMHRVLRPGGRAIVMVPLREGPTDEDPGITDPAERQRRFGQDDHVRWYGDDLADRLRGAGFEVDVRSVDDVDPVEVDEQRLRQSSQTSVFVCHRR